MWAGEAGCRPASGPALSAGISLAPVLEWALRRPVRRKGPSRGCVTVRRPGRTRASRGSAGTRSTPCRRVGPTGGRVAASASARRRVPVHRRKSRGRLPLAVRQRKVRVQASIPASRRMRSRRWPMPAGFGCRGRRTTRWNCCSGRLRPLGRRRRVRHRRVAQPPVRRGRTRRPLRPLRHGHAADLRARAVRIPEATRSRRGSTHASARASTTRWDATAASGPEPRAAATCTSLRACPSASRRTRPAAAGTPETGRPQGPHRPRCATATASREHLPGQGEEREVTNKSNYHLWRTTFATDRFPAWRSISRDWVCRPNPLVYREVEEPVSIVCQYIDARRMHNFGAVSTWYSDSRNSVHFQTLSGIHGEAKVRLERRRSQVPSGEHKSRPGSAPAPCGKTASRYAPRTT